MYSNLCLYGKDNRKVKLVVQWKAAKGETIKPVMADHVWKEKDEITNGWSCINGKPCITTSVERIKNTRKY